MDQEERQLFIDQLLVGKMLECIADELADPSTTTAQRDNCIVSIRAVASMFADFICEEAEHWGGYDRAELELHAKTECFFVLAGQEHWAVDELRDKFAALNARSVNADVG